jgi:dienelactone hydrolase
MSSAAGRPIPSPRESPVIFPANGNELFGIFTEPQQPAKEVVVVLLTGAGQMPMTHRNRLWVRLAHRLAAEGFPVLRFDYHGAGESTGEISAYWLDRPLVGDLEGAVRWLRGRHVSKLAMVGSCFGARTILAGADRVPELQAAVLLSPPLRGDDYQVGRSAGAFTLVKYFRKALRLRVFRRMLDAGWREAYLGLLKRRIGRLFSRMERSPSRSQGRQELRWVSQKFLRPLRAVVRRQVPLLLLYGREDPAYHDFEEALRGDLGDIVSEGRETIELRTVEGVLHGFTTLELQRAALEHTFAWLRDQYGSVPGAAGVTLAQSAQQKEVAPS